MGSSIVRESLIDRDLSCHSHFFLCITFVPCPHPQPPVQILVNSAQLVEVDLLSVATVLRASSRWDLS